MPRARSLQITKIHYFLVNYNSFNFKRTPLMLKNVGLDAFY